MKIPGRERTVWNLVEHIGEIVQVYKRVAEGEIHFDRLTANAEPAGRVTVNEMHEAIGKLDTWLATTVHDYSRTVAESFGPASLHYVLEHTVWHTAQHLRQLESLMEKAKVRSFDPLSPRLFEGLPMPRKVWD